MVVLHVVPSRLRVRPAIVPTPETVTGTLTPAALLSGIAATGPA
jgi:hypothetical protein